MRRSQVLSLAAAAVAAPQIISAEPLEVVRIGAFPAESYGLTIIARHQGFFERNGIDAQISYFASGGGAITPAVVAAALDAGCSSMGGVSNAHLRGIPLRMIATGGVVSSEAPTTEVVVLKSSPYHSAKDLEGKLFGTVALHDTAHAVQMKWLDVNGGDSSTARFVEMPPNQAVAALSAGRIDSYQLSEPFLSNTRDQFRSLGALYDCISRRTMIAVHIAMQDWLDKNPVTARRFVTSMRQAARWSGANKSAAGTIIANEAKLPPEVVAKMRHVVYSETFEAKMLQPQIDVLAEYKFIDRRYNVSEVIWASARD